MFKLRNNIIDESRIVPKYGPVEVSSVNIPMIEYIIAISEITADILLYVFVDEMLYAHLYALNYTLLLY